MQGLPLGVGPEDLIGAGGIGEAEDACGDALLILAIEDDTCRIETRVGEQGLHKGLGGDVIALDGRQIRSMVVADQQ
ncbi:hypothetical protein D3C71_1938390 [compost metagenome]